MYCLAVACSEVVRKEVELGAAQFYANLPNGLVSRSYLDMLMKEDLFEFL